MIFTIRDVFIPNNEIRGEYVNAIAASEWGEVSLGTEKFSGYPAGDLAEKSGSGGKRNRTGAF